MNKKFIKAGNEYSSFEKYVPAPYLRRTFQMDSKSHNLQMTLRLKNIGQRKS